LGIGRRRLRGFVATTCPCALPERSTGIRRGRDSRGVSRDFSRTGRSRCLQWNRHCARNWADGCSTRRDLGSRGATRRVVSQVHRLGTGWLKRRMRSDSCSGDSPNDFGQSPAERGVVHEGRRKRIKVLQDWENLGEEFISRGGRWSLTTEGGRVLQQRMRVRCEPDLDDRRASGERRANSGRHSSRGEPLQGKRVSKEVGMSIF